MFDKLAFTQYFILFSYKLDFRLLAWSLAPWLMTFQMPSHITSTWSQLFLVKKIKLMTTAYLLLMKDQIMQQVGKLSSQRE